MSKLLHAKDNKDDAITKAIAIPRVFSENSCAKNLKWKSTKGNN